MPAERCRRQGPDRQPRAAAKGGRSQRADGLPACGKEGLTWTGNLGFVGISVSSERFIGEGVNEAGLTAGLFYFKGFGSLAPYAPENTADNITDMDLVRWMLSRFRTVEEVRAALDDITIVPVHIDEQGVPSPTAHWRVTDRGGASIVIEIIDNGRVTIHDNTVGVLTNSPGFEWQVLNLNNFDIPLGTEFGAAERKHIPDLPSATQWTAVSDQTNGVFYCTSMHDSAVRRVDLNRIDFTQGEETARALDQGRFTVLDVTP